MHYYSNTKSVYIELINSLFLIICNDLWGNKTRSTTFRKDNIFLVLVSCKPIINYFQSLSCLVLIQTVFLLKQNILRLYISMHDSFSLQIFYPFKHLSNNSPYLMRFHIIFLPSILNFLIQCCAVQQL